MATFRVLPPKKWMLLYLVLKKYVICVIQDIYLHYSSGCLFPCYLQMLFRNMFKFIVVEN
jgi:hypothetical protein